MKKLMIIAGLCVMETSRETIEVAETLKHIMSQYPEIDFIFKASWDKANRTSGNSYRGIGIVKGLEILSKVRKLGIKNLTDIHSPHQAKILGNRVDIIQIPAFLCRQTDLVKAVGYYAKTVNIKKGQFLAPEDVIHIIKKIEATGNKKIMITERGTCFGYNNLIVDYRSFMIMKKFGYPVIFDVTHSQQMPSSDNGVTGGSTEFVIPLVKGALATGAISGLFLECHPSPKDARCDSSTSLNFKQVEKLIKESVKMWKFINE